MPKRFTLVCVAVFIFIFIFVFDLLFHGVYLKSIYEQTNDVWRSGEAMKTYIARLTLGQLIITTGFVALFTKAFKHGDIIGGAVYGLLLAIEFIGTLLINYMVETLIEMF